MGCIDKRNRRAVALVLTAVDSQNYRPATATILDLLHTPGVSIFGNCSARPDGYYSKTAMDSQVLLATGPTLKPLVQRA